MYPVQKRKDNVRDFSLIPHMLKRCVPNQRWEWKLICPHCGDTLGDFVCAPPDVELSVNQQCKNQAVLLLGQSHAHYRQNISNCMYTADGGEEWSCTFEQEQEKNKLEEIRRLQKFIKD